MNLRKAEIAYENVIGDGDPEDLEEAFGSTKVRVAGIVVRMVDKIMHGMPLGTLGMHEQVRLWAKQGYIQRLIKALLDRGFRVYLTSDHGNVEATGVGRLAEGARAELRGERVRVYSDSTLRSMTAAKYPDAIEWSSKGLPENYLPLLAPGRSAFVNSGERVVSHGGISIEELIVPFVKIGQEES